MLGVLFSNLFLVVGILASKAALHSLSPVCFLSIRMLLASSVVLSYLIFVSKSRFRVSWIEFQKILFMVFFTSLLPLILKTTALRSVDSARYAFWGSLDPFVAAFWSFVFWREALSLRQVLAVLMCCFSVFLAFSNINAVSFFYYDLLMVASVFLGKLGWVLCFNFLKNTSLSVIQINSLVSFLTGVGAFGIMFLGGEFSCEVFQSRPGAGFFLSALASFSYLLGYFFFTNGLRSNNFVLVSMIGSSIPLLVGVVEFVCFNKSIDQYLFFSIVINAFSVFLFSIYSGKCK